MRNRHVVYPIRIVLEQFVWQSAFLTVIDEDDTHIVKVDIPLEAYHVEERLAQREICFIVSDNEIKSLARINLSSLSHNQGYSATAVHVVFRQ